MYDPEGPGEHDEHLLDDEDNDYLPCPECGEPILAVADRCHHCGAAFDREVWRLGPRGTQRLAALVLVVLIILALLYYFTL